MKAANFEYIKGNAHTATPWFRPDPVLLNSWKEDFFKIPNVKNYQYWICGGAMEKWQTWDTDIIVVGELGEIKELEEIMVTGTQLGFKHRQLLDINWNNYYKKYLQKGSCNRRGICCDHYLENNWCNIEHCITQALDIETITISPEIIKNGVPLSRGNPGAQKLSDSLWKMTMVSPSLKQVKRIKQGIIYKHDPVLLTEELDFKDIVDWP